MLAHYEGWFAEVEVGVAWSLYARLGPRAPACLRHLDLRSLTRGLVAGAGIWSLPEAGDRRWPAGVHVFTTMGRVAWGPGFRRVGLVRAKALGAGQLPMFRRVEKLA